MSPREYRALDVALGQSERRLGSHSSGHVHYSGPVRRTQSLADVLTVTLHGTAHHHRKQGIKEKRIKKKIGIPLNTRIRKDEIFYRFLTVGNEKMRPRRWSEFGLYLQREELPPIYNTEFGLGKTCHTTLRKGAWEMCLNDKKHISHVPFHKVVRHGFPNPRVLALVTPYSVSPTPAHVGYFLTLARPVCEEYSPDC